MCFDQKTHSRFEERFIPEPMSGCFLWIGSLNIKGYGAFSAGGSSISAHRFAYLRDKGPVPDGLEIHHHCNVRCCVNSDHLEAVTHHENLKLKPKVRLEVCKNGHAYTHENTRILHTGGITCRTCVRQWKKEARERKRISDMGKPKIMRLKLTEAQGQVLACLAERTQRTETNLVSVACGHRYNRWAYPKLIALQGYGFAKQNLPDRCTLTTWEVTDAGRLALAALERGEQP